MDVENGGEGGGVGGRVGGGRSWDRLREGRDRGQERRRWISNMLGQMHGPTVVCHSCRFRSFRYLFPLNVLLSPFTSSSTASLFLAFSFSMSPATVSTLVYLLPLIMRFSRLLPSLRASLDRLFFSSSSRNYSFHCCMHTDNV